MGRHMDGRPAGERILGLPEACRRLSKGKSLGGHKAGSR